MESMVKKTDCCALRCTMSNRIGKKTAKREKKKAKTDDWEKENRDVFLV